MKRTENITLRCTTELKEELKKIAEEKRWTLSQTATIVIEEFIEEYKKKNNIKNKSSK